MMPLEVSASYHGGASVQYRCPFCGELHHARLSEHAARYLPTIQNGGWSGPVVAACNGERFILNVWKREGIPDDGA